MKILGILLIVVGLLALLSVVWPIIAIGAGVVILASTLSDRSELKIGFGFWFAWPKFFRKDEKDASPDEPENGHASV